MDDKLKATNNRNEIIINYCILHNAMISLLFWEISSVSNQGFFLLNKFQRHGDFLHGGTFRDVTFSLWSLIFKGNY